MIVKEAAIAAINGGIEDVKVGDHPFNIKAVTHGWEGDEYVISGRISHRKKWATDDQFDYKENIGVNSPFSIF